ncbi:MULTISPECIES: hypothetical protein [unclassified Lysinibacillus]|uniref:hypothetical protein n=1 Tax=unclassified Lysinibacillus TaxID=2636778 RepID=UPI002011602B|nr:MULTISPECIES: hypothetical protein [unclassified Lysinibacillus]MCL1694752.1 hypothetical protein [Lysinibacillus sp. BPa_S21]MCL1699605.1 hypothetical protein [Lysinibacillus sp. Bpr_S20]
MKQVIEEIELFLKNPLAEEESFWDSEALVWVDWKDFDDSIVEYFNDFLLEEDKINVELVENDKPRCVDIFLIKDEVKKAIPYDEEKTDRDTTLKAVQDFIAPKYQIRWYMDSLGGDTLAFCLLPTEKWLRLEKEYGEEKVAYYFAPLSHDSVMFEMDIDEMSDLLEKRKQKVN